MAGDGSMATMTRWLRENGYRTHRAGIRANVGCSEEYLRRLEDRLEQLFAATGQRVAIVGQSRGGGFARGLAGPPPGPGLRPGAPRPPARGGAPPPPRAA